MKPRVAITVGDPAGIGPEIARKAAADPRILDVCEPRLYGPTDASFPMGVLSAEAGRAAYDAICAAVSDAQAGLVDAVATAPVNKLAFAQAGLPWKGHTDLLAHLTGSPRVAMMFWSEPLKVVLATIHVPLASVPRLLTRDVLDGIIDLTASGLPRFGIAQPRIALAGLNPHAGEDGLLGEEEQRVLAPAVTAARARGVRIDGPFPADTLFVRASRGEFDVVIACYHDQGLIPVKLLAFGQAVNVTLGLPIIRTSVDHGTAFDIAGKNVADASSMVVATLLAARLAAGRPTVAEMPTVTVLFDGGCPLCRRTARTLTRIDWLHRLRFVDGTDASAREREAPGLTEAQVLVEMYVVGADGRRHGGYDGYLEMSRRVPLMWPFAIVGRLPGIRQAGDAIYRAVAANRIRRGRCTDDVCAPVASSRR